MSVKECVVKSIFKFVFEIEIGFESVDKDVKKNLSKFVKSLEKQDVFDEWAEKEYENLSNNIEKIKNINEKIKKNEKINNQEFDFLNEVVIFSNILDLKSFKDENRNTKKDVCMLMYNIYKTLQIIKKGKDYNLPDEDLYELYNKCIVKIEKPEKPILCKLQSPRKRTDQQQVQPPLQLGGGALQNLVTDMLSEFQKGELNPMELIQDIMKGPENIKKEGSAINRLTKKYEQRFSDDNVKKELETQLGSLMKNVENVNLKSNKD